MQPFTTDSLVGKQAVDKLYKVHTTTKQDYMILVHIEVQGDRETGFSRRLFEYCYKIYDRQQLPVLPLVVLSDDDSGWRPGPFEMYVLGHRILQYDFLSVKLLEWTGQEDRLLASSNPFDNLIAMYLKARQTKNQPKARLKAKMAIFDRLLDNKGWERDDVVNFYKFLDGVMRLPKDLELQYHNHILEVEREKHMSYITSAEQIGIEKGLHLGLERGIDQTTHMIMKNMISAGWDTLTIHSMTSLPEKEIDRLKEEQL